MAAILSRPQCVNIKTTPWSLSVLVMVCFQIATQLYTTYCWLYFDKQSHEPLSIQNYMLLLKDIHMIRIST